MTKISMPEYLAGVAQDQLDTLILKVADLSDSLNENRDKPVGEVLSGLISYPTDRPAQLTDFVDFTAITETIDALITSTERETY